jgi:hypothetical protein
MIFVDLKCWFCCVLTDEVERRLRLEAVKRLGGKKGALSAAIETAVKDWLNKKL